MKQLVSHTLVNDLIGCPLSAGLNKQIICALPHVAVVLESPGVGHTTNMRCLKSLSATLL